MSCKECKCLEAELAEMTKKYNQLWEVVTDSVAEIDDKLGDMERELDA